MGLVDQINASLVRNNVNNAMKPYINLKHQRPKKANTKMPDWEDHIQQTYSCKCFQCPGLYANELMNFVGFRGYQKRSNSKSHSKGLLNILDVKGKEHEGEAHPEPKVPVTYVNEENLKRITGKTKEQLGRLYFLGILEYEVEILTLKYTLEGMGYPHQMVLMGRGLGKTWMEDWENSIRMKYFAQNILLLSESDAGKDVGDWIHTWATENKHLESTNKRKGGKRGSYLDFKLHNGAKLYVYAYMEKHSLGKHEIRIVMDDAVNLDWQNRPSDEKRARKHWHSNLDHMNRTGLDIWGTRKYEGDLLGHFIKVIPDLVLIKISPFKQCPHQLTPNDNGVYDECSICRNDNLLAPEIHSYEEYMDKKEGNYDSWYSEQMQDPYRKEGGMVEPSDIHYVRRPQWFEDVTMGGTGVDLADTLDDKNDMVGIVSCLMQSVPIDSRTKTRKFTFHASDVARRLARNIEVKEKKKPCDWTTDDGKRIVRGIIESVQLQCEYHFNNYPNIPYIIAWERNKNGIAIMEQALREFRNKEKVEIRKDVWVLLTWPAYLVPDRGEAIKIPHDGDTNIKLGITHNNESKETRVYSQLQYSIKKGQTRFTPDQEYSVFMSQLLGFPKAKHDDGPDAGGMIKDELNRRYSVYSPPGKPPEVVKYEKEMKKAAKNFTKLKYGSLVDGGNRRRIL
jgi:hypothetical protein